MFLVEGIMHVASERRWLVLCLMRGVPTKISIFLVEGIMYVASGWFNA